MPQKFKNVVLIAIPEHKMVTGRKGILNENGEKDPEKSQFYRNVYSILATISRTKAAEYGFNFDVVHSLQAASSKYFDELKDTLFLFSANAIENYLAIAKHCQKMQKAKLPFHVCVGGWYQAVINLPLTMQFCHSICLGSGQSLAPFFDHIYGIGELPNNFIISEHHPNSPPDTINYGYSNRDDAVKFEGIRARAYFGCRNHCKFCNFVHVTPPVTHFFRSTMNSEACTLVDWFRPQDERPNDTLAMPSMTVVTAKDGISEAVRFAMSKPIPREKPLVALEYFRHKKKPSISWACIAATPFEQDADWEEYAEFIQMCKLRDDKTEMHHVSLHHFIPSRLTPLEHLPVNQLSVAGHLRKYGIADGSHRGSGSYNVQTRNVRFKCGSVSVVNTDALLSRSLRSLDETLALVPSVSNGKYVDECGEQTKDSMYSPQISLADCIEGTIIRENIVKKRFTNAEMIRLVEHYRDRQKSGKNITPAVKAGLQAIHEECKKSGELPLEQLQLFV